MNCVKAIILIILTSDGRHDLLSCFPSEEPSWLQSYILSHQKKAVGWQNPNDAEWTCNGCGSHYYLPGYSPQKQQPHKRLLSDYWNGYSDPDDFPTDGYDIGDGY